MKHVENLLSLYSRRPSRCSTSFARPTAQISPSITRPLSVRLATSSPVPPIVALSSKVATNSDIVTAAAAVTTVDTGLIVVANGQHDKEQTSPGAAASSTRTILASPAN